MATRSPTTRTTTAAEPVGKRLVRGAIGGFLAGLPFVFVTMWFADSLGNPAEAPLRLIHSLVAGPDALMDGTTEPWIGFVVHSVLSVAFGMLFALVVPLFRSNGTVAVAGGLFGLALYLVNFQIIARFFVERFLENPNQPFELVVHVLFGHLLALAFYSSGTRRDERIIDLTTSSRSEERVPANA